MSESIHSGYLPLWNPYINFGFPQYGDMSSGYWSPVTWLIASTVGYNAYSFTLELLCYILIGGLGFYKLTGSLKLNEHLRWISAVAYMCCGYNIGHLQHFNWISGAAFLPWCFWSYLALMGNFSLKNIAITALLFYMLISSAHPGIIISSFYFFMALALYYFFTHNRELSFARRVKQFFPAHLFFLTLLILLSAGMISGYLDILPHFVRSEKLDLATSLQHPSTFQSWISVLLPFSTVKNDLLYNTDISMRNCYFSMALLLFFLLSLFSKKTSLQKLLLAVGLSFGLLSTGGIFKTIAYKCIPLIGYVRLNGEFRIFAIFCFVLIAAIELNKFIREKKTFSGTIKWIYYTVELTLFLVLVFGMYKAFHQKESLFYHIENIFAEKGLASKLKKLIDVISFYDTLWIQGLLQLFLLWGIKWCLRFGNWKLLKQIVVADMIFASLFNIPFTGAGKASVATVQAVLNKSPQGIPIPSMSPIMLHDSLNSLEKGMVGDWSMYSKQIGTQNEVPYPIILKNMRLYFEKDAVTKKENYLSKPFIFSTDTSNSAAIKIHSFSPQRINLEVNHSVASQIVLQQNFYPHWFYNNGKQKKEMQPFGVNFMSAPCEKGNNNVAITFEPTVVKYAMLVSLLVFLLCCGIAAAGKTKPSSPS